jgi:hypothetical protein
MQTQQTITFFGTVSDSATNRTSKTGRKYTAFGVPIISDRNLPLPFPICKRTESRSRLKEHLFKTAAQENAPLQHPLAIALSSPA